jgi:sugar lactone lactonase YvrE
MATLLKGSVVVTADSSGTVYVGSTSACCPSNPEVLEYASGASGNVAPTRTIGGALTGLGSIDGLAVDSSGTLYVANFSGNSVTEYASGASGNIAPTITISGALTGISEPNGIAVDSSGTVYVSNRGNNSVTEYAAGFSGNNAPTNTISGALTTFATYYPVAIAVDSSKTLYAINLLGSSVLEFASGASGNVAPTNNLTGGLVGMTGLAVDPSGTVYESEPGRSSPTPAGAWIASFAAGASGNVAPTSSMNYEAIEGPVGLGYR